MKTYKRGDRKEPRFRLSKFRYTVLNKELYDQFRGKNSSIRIDYESFKDIVKEINEEIVSHVINNREGVYLPAGMGRLYMGLYPPKERPDNDEMIRDKSVKATHFNFDTSGFMGKIVWVIDGTKYKTDNLKFYGFIGHRNFKSRASHGFRTNPELYTRIATMIQAHEYYKRINNERNEINSQGGDQPSEDTEQGS